MTKAQNGDGENIGILLKKLELYTSMLEGRRVQPSRHLQKFYNEIKSKEKEDVLAELIDFYLGVSYNKDDCINMYRPEIVKIINSQFASTFDGKKFIVNNLTKILKLGFENGELKNDFTILILELAKKQSEDVESTQKQKKKYQYIVNQYKEISSELGKIRKGLIDLAGYNNGGIENFNNFINFIYETSENIKEQDKQKELERKNAEEKLLEEESLCKQEVSSSLQSQNKKKKKNSRNSKKPAEENQSGLADLPQASNDKEVPINDNKGAETKWGEKLSTLIRSKFPNEESKEFEKEIRQAMVTLESNDQTDDNNQTIEQLDCVEIDFYLSRAQHNIRDYNSKYGQTIEKTKGKFGTPNFDREANKLITSNLSEIALYIENINNDLTKARLLLDKITPLVYRNHHNNQTQDNQQWLEISGDNSFKLLNKFLGLLKDLVEWRNNKLDYVLKNNVRSSKTKTNEEKATEIDALKNIESCVDSINEFMSIYKKSSAQDNVNLPIYGPHQEWCILINPKIEQAKIQEEFRRCSC